jgi:hypothetical protein
MCFPHLSAEELWVIPEKTTNLEKIEAAPGIDIYGVMQSGILAGASRKAIDNFPVSGSGAVYIGERDESAEYFIFHIEDADIQKLPDYIDLIYYKGDEGIARTKTEIDAQSSLLMKGLTHLSFRCKPVTRRQSSDYEQGLVTDVWIDEIVGLVSQTEYTANVQRLQDFVTRYSYTDSCRTAENWAINEFSLLGLETELFPYTHLGDTWYDAIGRHTGMVYPDSIYILIAHIDATSENPQNLAPGAEDNASGSACVLEAARVLSQYDFDCTIEFVLVSGEEQGLYGSEAYAQYCYNNQRNIAGVLNFDMIAYAGTYGWDINIFSDETFGDEVALADLMASLMDEYSDAYSVRVNTVGPVYGSDHYYFSYYGFPAPFAIDAQLWSAPDWYPWYHTTSDVITNLDLDYATEVVKGAVATAATVAGQWSLPALFFSYPDGLPELINPSGGTSFVVEIDSGTANPQPGTEMLYYSDADSFLSVPITMVSPGVYNAVFPPTACGDEISFYISVETDENSLVTDPSGAPDEVFSALSAAGLTTVFNDNFENDLWWTVQSTCSDGQWQRGVPAGGGERGDPPADFDGSGYCYVTDNEYGNTDVDDGYTWLISPAFPLSEQDAIISYAIWYTNNSGDAPNSDLFKVFLSNNNGSTWVAVDSIGPHTSPGWNLYSLRVNEYLVPGDFTRIRFEASDVGAGSVVEAGVDAVSVRVIDCEVLLPGAIAGTVTDINGPVPDVFVNVTGDFAADSTDEAGNYILADLNPGTYIVSFSHPDYYDTTIAGIPVESDSTTSLDVYLTRITVSYDYLPGDANMYIGQWPPQVIGGDVTYLIGFFRGLNPACLLDGTYAAADVNADCQVIGSDVTKMVSYFRGFTDLSYCPDRLPAWLAPDDLPADAPSGWPNCDLPITSSERIK